MVNRCRGKETIRGCQERWNLRHHTYITLMSPAHSQSALVCSLPSPYPTNLYLPLSFSFSVSLSPLSLALSLSAYPRSPPSHSLSYHLPFSTVFTSISFFFSHPPSLSLVLPLLFLTSYFLCFSRHFFIPSFIYLYVYVNLDFKL